MELDDAYANAAYIDNAEGYPPMWAEKAEAFRVRLGDRAKLDLAYGAAEREKFDLFLPEADPAGLFVFVHGGYWKAFDKSYWSDLAEGALARGWAVAMPSYTLAPEARIAQITGQIAAAITAAAGQVAGPIVLAGHSAGGHLVARMLAPGMLEDDVAGRIAHVMPISPVADLRPLLRTSMNEILQLDEDEAAAESPVLTEDRREVPVTVWVGGDERPAFLDQAIWLSEAWSAGLVVAQGKHHFDVIAPLADPRSDMVRGLLAGAG
jgi:acetyl esterase/lipase